MEQAKTTAKRIAKQLNLSLTAKAQELARVAEVITLDPAEIKSASYQHAILCQVGMPRKRTNSLTFERHNGYASLLVTAGKKYDPKTRIWVQQPLPYGPKARLILINLTTFAVRHRTRCIDVGRSTREFLKRVGLDDQGSEYRSLKTQIHALAVCRMQLASGFGNRLRQMDTQPIRGFDVLLTGNPDQQILWPGTVELSHEYFESCLESAVPLDDRAVAALRGSALALDVYSWLAHRLWRIRHAKGVLVSWTDLRDQFGIEYHDMRDFRKKFRIALQHARAVYPDARLDLPTEGIVLRHSKPPIPPVRALPD